LPPELKRFDSGGAGTASDDKEMGEMGIRNRRAPLLAGAAVVVALAGASLLGSGSQSGLGLGATARADTGCPWQNTALSPDQRARLLLDASTLDQKLRWLDEQSANNPAQTTFSGGITMPAQVPCTPVIQYTDGPAAVVSGAGTGITAFPAQTTLAATWDVDLARQKGKAQGYEAFHKHRNVILAPGIMSGRQPRSGRTNEYFGEDPILSGTLAAAMARGFHDNPSEPVESVLKHYVANEQETDRQTSSSNVDPRTLREIYTLPFEIAIAGGGVQSVMCSYNQVNGVPACGNDDTLRQILKTEIGFGGFVMTDFGAAHSLLADPPSLKAGLDQELNRWRFWTPALIHQQLDAGRITEADVDAAAFRVVRAHFAAGLFDVPLPAAPEAIVSTPEAQAIARREVEEGSVLLKNDGSILPLSPAVKKIAVIGPTASSTPTNGISAASVCSATAPAVPCTPTAPLDSIAARAAAAGASVTFADGSDPAAAAATAAAADVAVVFGYYREGEFADRPNLSLDGNGDALISAVAAANPKTVVVLETGGPVLMPWLDLVEGVLWTAT
jgi:beta-glucosidase